MFSFLSSSTPPKLHLSSKKPSDGSPSNGFVAFDGRMNERENQCNTMIAEFNELIAKAKLSKPQRPMSPMMFGKARPKSKPLLVEVPLDEKKVIPESKADKPKGKEWKKGVAAVLENIVVFEATTINASHQELLKRYDEIANLPKSKITLEDVDDLASTSKELLTKARKCTSEVIKFITECRTTEVGTNLLPLLGLEAVSEQFRDIFERTIYEHIQPVSNVVEDNLEKIFCDVQRVKLLLAMKLEDPDVATTKRPGV